MALLRTSPVSLTPAAASVSQVAFNSSTAANTAWFTVPTGRVYVGFFSNTATRNTTLINGTEIRAWGGGAAVVGDGGNLVQYTLIAGTVVSEGTTAGTSRFVGVSYPV